MRIPAWSIQLLQGAVKRFAKPFTDLIEEICLSQAVLKNGLKLGPSCVTVDNSGCVPLLH